MKVLMQARTNLLTLRGGDTVQILKTKEFLEKNGIDVTLSTKVDEDLTGYDIVHLFNLTRVQETYLQAKKAKEAKKPIVLSTIYWPTDELELKGQLPMRRVLNRLIGVERFEKLKIFLKYFKGENEIELKKLFTKSFSNMQKEIIEMSDWLLPNSNLEIYELEKKLKIKIDNFNSVVNAIDPIQISENNDEFDKYNNSIICIGRIEPRKNQLNLVKALYNTDYNVYIIGKPAPNHIKYYELVKANANKNTTFVDYMDNKDIYKVCSNAKVHVLPSWYDTPGLVSLEAGVCGCNIVVSDKGTTKEYFKDYATYCAPDNLDSIREAVELSYKKKKNDKLKNYIQENYTWNKAALQTIYAYKKIYRNGEE